MKPCLQEDVLQMYLDGELARETSDGVVAHLAQCASCALRVRDTEHTLMAIGGAIESQLPDVTPTARLRARLESALVEKAAPKFTLATLLNWKLAAVAVGLLLMLSAIASFWQPASKPQHEEQIASPMPGSTPDSQTTPPKPTEPPIGPAPVAARQPEKLRKRVPRRAFKTNSDEAEVVTQFFPLRGGEDLLALESMRMVRVELPGSAFSEVGLLVSIETANALIKADVLLGDDGLARAIRFVR